VGSRERETSETQGRFEYKEISIYSGKDQICLNIYKQNTGFPVPMREIKIGWLMNILKNKYQE
jgi:hypothetical protein